VNAEPKPVAHRQSSDAPTAADWSARDYPAETALPDDPLLACLILLTRHYERPRSADALLTGLPLVDGRLTPALFLRAAAKADLAAQVVRRPLKSLHPAMLPAVLLTRGRGALLVMSVQPNGQVAVIDPAAGNIVQAVQASDLAARHEGHILLVRPMIEARNGAELAEEPPRSWFWGTLARYWPVYAQVALVAIFINLFAIAVPLVTMNVYDRVVPNNAVETLWVLALGGILVLMFDFVMRTLRAYLIDLAGRRADILLSAHVMNRVLDIQLAARPQSAGSFANNLREFETLRDFFTSATLTAIVDLPFAFLFVLAIWYIGGPTAYVALVAIPLVVVVGLILQRPLDRVFREAHREAAVKHGLLVEIIGGLETIKSLGAASRMQRSWELLVGKTAEVAQKSRLLSGVAVNFSSFVQQAATIGVLVVGVYQIKEGNITMGALVASSMLLGRALAPLAQLANLMTRYNQSMTALRGLDRIMELPGEHGAGRTYLSRPITQGAIEFRKVTFAYPGSTVASVDGVSFRIASGERVGIIGRVGSGKSTIARLILNLYQPREGAVLVDGADVRQIDPADLRRGIGLVPQDIFLFQGTVRQNIAVRAPQVDDEQLLRAARIAGVDDFVAQHPDGYDLSVGERGERLSGGQRQSIAIARALVGDPPILVLDEPTAAMDNTSERNLRSRILSFMPGHTIVLITHRASLLALVDRVIVLDGGKVVADGPRDQVIQALTEGRVKGAT